MSRDLPPNPNLEHLKKQAKALLEKLRQQNANATLVDAQHALAREYGFASWPKLVGYFEDLARQTHAGPRDVEMAAPADGRGPVARLLADLGADLGTLGAELRRGPGVS